LTNDVFEELLEPVLYLGYHSFLFVSTHICYFINFPDKFARHKFYMKHAHKKMYLGLGGLRAWHLVTQENGNSANGGANEKNIVNGRQAI